MTRTVERAVVKSTGDIVTILRRRGPASDAAIIRALEAAGHFVVESPAGIRYRRQRARHFTTPPRDAVYLIGEDGSAKAIVPGPYFYAHYRVIAEADA